MLIHGLAEHLGCYEELGCRMAAENFLAFGHDHRKLFLSFFFSFPSSLNVTDDSQSQLDRLKKNIIISHDCTLFKRTLILLSHLSGMADHHQ
jgi:hexokinase